MSTTFYMSLLLPIPTITPGPTYASEEVTAFTTIDSHDHTPGFGKLIPTLGLNINNDLTFNDFNATILRSTQYQIQSAVLSLPTDLACIYSVNGNLYWNNNLGQPVQITSGAAIDATSIGGIGGDYATSTALLFYTSADSTFTFWSDTNVPANIDAGAITIRTVTTSPNGITINSPNALPASYDITLPSALPPTTSVLTEDPTGQVGYAVGSLIPSGGVIMFGGTVVPTGFLLCDGTSYLITDYPTLAAALFDSGTSTYAYGTADIAHFNVPDMRGIFPRGVNGGASNDPDASSRTAANTGGNTGNNVGSAQTSALANHQHPEYTNSGAGGSANTVQNTTNGGNILSINSTGNVSGATTSSETRPINTYFNFIIKT